MGIHFKLVPNSYYCRSNDLELYFIILIFDNNEIYISILVIIFFLYGMDDNQLKNIFLYVEFQVVT